MRILKPIDVETAADRLRGIINHTPVHTSRVLNQKTGLEIFFKCENFQRAGAFKFRGAYHALSQLPPEKKSSGVITHSSGNHAQGLSLAAQLLDIKAMVVMPEDAPKLKREATIGYGAKIVSCKAIEREEVTNKLVDQFQSTLVHPYDNDDIIVGQGTSALELFAEVGTLDLLFVPVGGGGLISGCALAAAHANPSCRVIGVEPELGNDANRSWRSGKIVSLNVVPSTMADGLRTRQIGARNLKVMRHYVHDMVTVSEEEILSAFTYLWQRMKLVVEPSAAVALAPLLSRRYSNSHKRVGVILSGGNVDPSMFRLGQIEPEFITPVKHNALESQHARFKVVIAEPFDKAGKEMLRAISNVVSLPKLLESDVRSALKDADALVVGNKTRVSGTAIEYAHHLRVIASTSSRLDNIDVSAARAHGVDVLHSPGSDALAVAEHTISLVLEMSKIIKQGSADSGLAGKTLGIVGFGRIGREVAKRALSFDMKVLVNQPRLTPELALSEVIATSDLRELLSDADFVTLHVPFKPETNGMLGTSELSAMKPSAFLINISSTELIDDAAMLTALDNGWLQGAALGTFEAATTAGELRPSTAVRNHPKVHLAKHVTAFQKDNPQAIAVDLAEKIIKRLQVVKPSDSLSLEIIPINQTVPHEEIDEKRVDRLMSLLEKDGQLVNPPVVTSWDEGYVVLDGATRFSALKRLGFRYLIAQVVPSSGHDFDLHTWYHVISGKQSAAQLFETMKSIRGLSLESFTPVSTHATFADSRAICYFHDRNGRAMLALAETVDIKLQVMAELVRSYTELAQVERTLITDVGRLYAQFPDMIAVNIFPQLNSQAVFKSASSGRLLPAGLTRFVIPGRILRLNADLSRLKKEEHISAKRQWLNAVLEEKLARSRLRYYSEPVVLLDE